MGPNAQEPAGRSPQPVEYPATWPGYAPPPPPPWTPPPTNSRRGNAGWWAAAIAGVLVVGLIGVLIGRSLLPGGGPAIAQATATATLQPAVAINATATSLASGPAVDLFQQVTSQPPTLSDPLTGQDANNWETTSPTDAGACYFAGGLYYATQHTPGFRTQCRLMGRSFGNLALRVHMSVAQGDLAGVTFCVSPDDSLNIGYRFEMDASGSWSLVASAGHNPTTLESGTAINFNTGYGQTNIVMVIVKDGQINLYVNSTFLAAAGLDRSEPTTGLVGTYVYERTQATEATYSQLDIWDFS